MAPKATRKQKKRNSNRYEDLENDSSEGEIVLGVGPRRALETIDPLGAQIDAERVLEASNSQGNVQEHILPNIEQDIDSNGNIGPRGNLPSSSAVRSQVPFDIDTFITVISEKIDSRISESVRNATLTTNESTERAVSSLRDELSHRPDQARSQSVVADERDFDHVRGWNSDVNGNRLGFMATNVPLGGPSEPLEDRRVRGSNNALNRQDANLDETLAAEDVGPRNRVENPHSFRINR